MTTLSTKIATKYQVRPAQVSQWKRELLSGANSVFEQGKKTTIDDEYNREVSELHQKIGQLTVEVDWLKKN